MNKQTMGRIFPQLGAGACNSTNLNVSPYLHNEDSAYPHFVTGLGQLFKTLVLC